MSQIREPHTICPYCSRPLSEGKHKYCRKRYWEKLAVLNDVLTERGNTTVGKEKPYTKNMNMYLSYLDKEGVIP